MQQESCQSWENGRGRFTAPWTRTQHVPSRDPCWKLNTSNWSTGVQTACVNQNLCFILHCNLEALEAHLNATSHCLSKYFADDQPSKKDKFHQPLLRPLPASGRKLELCPSPPDKTQGWRHFWALLWYFPAFWQVTLFYHLKIHVGVFIHWCRCLRVKMPFRKALLRNCAWTILQTGHRCRNL